MTEPPVSRPAVGRLLAGRYHLRSVLGRGSMGTVWSAYDEVLLRPVALKEIRLPVGMPPEEIAVLRERTLREARTIAALSHPNVITVYDVEQADGAPFVVMELVSGRSLAALLRELGRLNTAQAAAVADAVAAALSAAHQAGITHRDVKPGNVLIGRDGRIKLTDFGIARNVSDSTMTHTGIVLGSPAFIAPEIAAGEQARPTADLWSLGAMLFAAVQGRPPYDVDGDALATITEVVHGEVPAAEVGGPLREVISALMVKDPAERISLSRLRRMIHPLLPEPGVEVFEPADLEPGDPLHEEPERQPEPYLGPVRTASHPAAPFDLPLSKDPGPLPFTAEQRVPRTHGPLPTMVVIIVAFVLFCMAVTAGFSVSRVLAGRSLAPPGHPDQPASVAVAPPSTGQLQLVSGSAATLNGARGGEFSIKVPQGWVSFTEQRTSYSLPTSTVVHYVSPDGGHEVTVERVPHFYPQHNTTQYLELIRQSWARHNYTLLQNYPIPDAVVSGREHALKLMYRTVEGGGGPGLGRTTFADVLPDSNDLWVVSVTVPTDEEDSGNATLFSQIAPTFRPED